MKRIIITLLTIIIVLGTNTAFASTTNKQLVKDYCKTHYKDCKIVYFTEWNYEKMTHRDGKNIVYVEVLKSTSMGKKDPNNNRYWGYIKGSNYYRTWYNKKVKKGKTVTQYLIYNPYTNYDDDIVAIVDNKKIR